MNAIILFSHGSVLCGGGKNLFQLARRLEARRAAPIVEVGFLNYSEPTFEAAFEKCIARGATTIIIAPYFLVAGYFVKVSLPPKIAAMKEKFPSVEVKVARAIQQDDLLVDAILGCADRAQEPAKWRDLLADAPRFCRNSPQCPLYDAATCPQLAQIAAQKGRSEVYASDSGISYADSSAFDDIDLPAGLADRLRALQNANVPLESALWDVLRDRQLNGARFKTRQPMGHYIADFYCPEAKLAIELEGGVLSSLTPAQRRQRREEAVAEREIRVRIIETAHFRANSERVLKSIIAALEPEALLVMVHGSPRPESNGDMFAVVEQVRHQGAFELVEVGFMECNEPAIPTAIDTLAKRGARKIVAVPYFLHTGTHVADDLPTLLEEAAEKHPHIHFSMGDYLGHDPLLDDVIVKRVMAMLA